MILLYSPSAASPAVAGAAGAASIVSLMSEVDRVDGDRKRVSSGPIATVFHAAHSTGAAPLTPGNVEDQERARSASDISETMTSGKDSPSCARSKNASGRKSIAPESVGTGLHRSTLTGTGTSDSTGKGTQPIGSHGCSCMARSLTVCTSATVATTRFASDQNTSSLAPLETTSTTAHPRDAAPTFEASATRVPGWHLMTSEKSDASTPKAQRSDASSKLPTSSASHAQLFRTSLTAEPGVTLFEASETVRWFAIETKGGAYRVAPLNAGTWRGSPARGECGKVIQLDRHVPAHPTVTVFPTSPVANIGGASPAPRTNEMANRLPETELVLDYAYLVRKDAMAAATHPDSEDRDNISPAEWDRIHRADYLVQWLTRLSAGVEHAIKVLHNGLDAPSVQRSGRELFGRGGDVHDEPHGMRR